MSILYLEAECLLADGNNFFHIILFSKIIMPQLSENYEDGWVDSFRSVIGQLTAFVDSHWLKFKFLKPLENDRAFIVTQTRHGLNLVKLWMKIKVATAETINETLIIRHWGISLLYFIHDYFNFNIYFIQRFSIISYLNCHIYLLMV